MSTSDTKTPLDAKIDYVLTEARVVLPGAQALLGFQLAIVLTNGFQQLSSNLAISTVTLLLLPILQATQNRDGAALQAKIDELILVHERARNSLIGVEERSNEEIEQIRNIEDREASPN